jgi:chromosome segregation ATPase
MHLPLSSRALQFESADVARDVVDAINAVQAQATAAREASARSTQLSQELVEAAKKLVDAETRASIATAGLEEAKASLSEALAKLRASEQAKADWEKRALDAEHRCQSLKTISEKSASELASRDACIESLTLQIQDLEVAERRASNRVRALDNALSARDTEINSLVLAQSSSPSSFSRCGEGGCHQWLDDKGRYCKISAKSGSKYCYQHPR